MQIWGMFIFSNLICIECCTNGGVPIFILDFNKKKEVVAEFTEDALRLSHAKVALLGCAHCDLCRFSDCTCQTCTDQGMSMPIPKLELKSCS
ncbi:hypothetical protein MTR_2g090090 [Medicago truncatula]|uniref:Uncharacterized protein n=1 Tax=Medicago truncatula TaxID=3880 RepID=A0A072VLN7_MEDTR|nr:hypothetical protein MTR_2g090090 [Medicago truncatula]